MKETPDRYRAQANEARVALHSEIRGHSGHGGGRAVETGTFADIVAFDGDLPRHMTELEGVRFVMTLVYKRSRWGI